MVSRKMYYRNMSCYIFFQTIIQICFSFEKVQAWSWRKSFIFAKGGRSFGKDSINNVQFENKKLFTLTEVDCWQCVT